MKQNEDKRDNNEREHEWKGGKDKELGKGRVKSAKRNHGAHPMG